MINTFILAPHPTCLSRFLDSFFFPLLPPPISSSLCHSTSHLHLPPTSFPGTELRPPGRLPHLPMDNRCRSLCAPHSVPVSSVVSCIVQPLRCRLWPAPRYLSAPGGSPAAGPSASMCPASLIVYCSDSCHLLGFGSSGYLFRVRTMGLGASSPWKSLVPYPKCMVTLLSSGYPPPLPPVPPPWLY